MPVFKMPNLNEDRVAICTCVLFANSAVQSRIPYLQPFFSEKPIIENMRITLAGLMNILFFLFNIFHSNADIIKDLKIKQFR